MAALGVLELGSASGGLRPSRGDRLHTLHVTSVQRLAVRGGALPICTHHRYRAPQASARLLGIAGKLPEQREAAVQAVDGAHAPLPRDSFELTALLLRADGAEPR